MKKNSLIAFLIGCLFMTAIMLGCSTSTTTGGNGTNPDALKFRAENVVFRGSTVKASDEFTDQKVYADDVVLDNANTSLTADNVQTAFEETQPKLSEIIVGEWDVVCYLSNGKSGDLDDFPPDIGSGTITFNEDGTLSTTGRGWIVFVDELDFHANGQRLPKKYSLYKDSILNVNYFSESYQVTKNNIITFESITQNKLVYKHVCGSIILTKK